MGRLRGRVASALMVLGLAACANVWGFGVHTLVGCTEADLDAGTPVVVQCQ